MQGQRHTAGVSSLLVGRLVGRRSLPAACYIAARSDGNLLGFSNCTLERRYSRIMLSPPQNMKPYLGHEG